MIGKIARLYYYFCLNLEGVCYHRKWFASTVWNGVKVVCIDVNLLDCSDVNELNGRING